MDFPRDEQRRAYIRGKVDRLQKARRGAAVGMIIVWAAALGLWSIKGISGSEAVLLMVLASAWASVTKALCDLHIDLLSALKLDLDRDLAIGLKDFETS